MHSCLTSLTQGQCCHLVPYWDGILAILAQGLQHHLVPFFMNLPTGCIVFDMDSEFWVNIYKYSWTPSDPQGYMMDGFPVYGECNDDNGKELTSCWKQTGGTDGDNIADFYYDTTALANGECALASDEQFNHSSFTLY